MEAIFSTQRLQLNLITETDQDFIIRLLNSDGWLQFIGDRNVHSTKDAIDYIQKIKNTADFFYWTVRLKATDNAIGIISFLKRSYLDHFDIGFAFLPEFTGQGYAYEAAGKVLSILSKTNLYSTVLATTLPGNNKSVRLLTKLGFHFEKEIEMQLDTLHVYSNSTN